MSVEALIAIVTATLIAFLILRRPERWQVFARTLRTAPVELAAAASLIALAIAALLGGRLSFGVALVAVAVLLLLAGHDLVRDYVLGVALRASGRIREGDIVVIDGHEGVVAEIGRLSVSLDDARGRLVVPHSTVARGIVHRRSQRVGPLPHRFELQWRGDLSHAEVTRLISVTVLLHPRAAVGRDPEVEPLGARTVAVTVYTVASAHGFDIERAVRDALDEPDTSRRLSLPPPPA